MLKTLQESEQLLNDQVRKAQALSEQLDRRIKRKEEGKPINKRTE